MTSAIFILICVKLLTIADGQRGRPDNLEKEPMQKTEMEIPISSITVQGVAGQTASLPCDTETRDNNDAVTMVLWFKESTDEPVYSYDARNLHHSKVKLWSAERVWGNRAVFRPTAPGQLVIQNVRESDAGEYRCRVDFRNSQTKNFKVNFTVIVPPLKPIIYDTKKRDMSKHLEAYPEGVDLDLICEVHGGNPKPRVTWYLESQAINSTHEEVKVENNNPMGNGQSSMDATSIRKPYTMIISRVKIKNLKRSHHHAKVSCRAVNTPLAAPQTTTVTIELYMKPLKVEIVGKEKVVTANKKYEIECQSTGSRPPALLSWYKGSKQLRNSSRDFQRDGMSISILEWVPNAEDEGKYLTCRAENRHLPEATIEDKWMLKVHYAPIVTLRVGLTTDPKDIKEGDDVSFACNVRSNPRNFKLTWYHENRELRHNDTAGIVLTDQSLVLQRITREASGNYSCLATNSAGSNRSNVVYLRVMYAPICKRLSPINPGDEGAALEGATAAVRPEETEADEEESEAAAAAAAASDADEETLSGFAGNEVDDYDPMRPPRLAGANGAGNNSSNGSSHAVINLVCEVEANPSSVTFHWTFYNNGSREPTDLPESHYVSEKTLSRLRHLLKSDSDYGTFGCWASNVVGHSKQPCLYHVPAPVRPLPLQNCTAQNQSGAWIRISCVEGFDGGLPQKFVAVVDEQRWESRRPSWEIEVSKPSTTVALYAVNAKGKSEPVFMEGIAFKDVAKFTGETGISIDISPILIGLGGTATGLGLIVTGVLMALWRKDAAAAASPSKPKPLQQPSIATFAVKGEEEDGNPDLIPTTALTNNYTDRKLSVYGSLPRRSNYTEELPQSIIQDMDYPRAAPNTYYSLQRPSRYTETLVRHTTVQESCI